MKSRTRIPTDPEMVILALLLKRGGEDMYGRAMVLEDCRLKENWIYVVLARMTRYGYLIARLETAEEKQGRCGPRRRLYKVTAYGKRMFEARLQSDSTAAVQFSHSAALQHQARRARRNSRCQIQRDVVRPVSPTPAIGGSAVSLISTQSSRRRPRGQWNGSTGERSRIKQHLSG
jgi:DNA-binding PadR family transcriptional regulator